ncbi:MAG: porin, partial [Burkholderiales bacterium]|nr:porin [Burkholderiales bacterium]
GRWTFHALATDVRISANQQRSSYVALDGGANYQLTPADTLGAGVSSTHFAGKRWTQLSVQDVYAFSKRTQFYASVLYERASANAVADITGIGPASGANQTVVLSGIHHSF